jgi:hypothetical protein
MSKYSVGALDWCSSNPARGGLLNTLKAKNRMLRKWLKRRSLRFSDKERGLLARQAFGIRRSVLLELGTIVTPDTLLR